MMSNVLPVLLLILSATFCLAADWSYSGETGPERWPDGNGAFCKGKSQSPIDIITGNAQPAALGEFTLVGYDLENYLAGSPVEVENTGHSVKIELDGTYELSGGGLPSTFQAVQFHFHWGSVTGQGSEHKIDGEAFAAELHIVHFDNKNYGDFFDALDDKDGKGLAVLGVMLALDDQENKAYTPVFDAIKKVVAEDTALDLNTTFSVLNLLPKDLTKFYRYEGSLTTPGCDEIVIWTLFEEPVPISQSQLNILRALTFLGHDDGHTYELKDNFRPIQHLNDRTVKFNGATILIPTAVYIIAVFTALFNL